MTTKSKFSNQPHVYQYWDQLSPNQRTTLENDLDSLDLERIQRIYTRAMTVDHGATQQLAPLPNLARTAETSSKKLAEWKQLGEDAIARGEVALLLLAGGQGTRLGSKDPKGMYDIGLPSHKSLFQLQAERLIKQQKQSTIPWYIMTSPATDAATRRYFEDKKFFDLSPENVVFFQQGTLPCLTSEGQILMENGWKVARSPDGNGGLYRGLDQECILEDMKKRGIKYIHAYGVDNSIVKVADPLFIGYCIGQNAPVGAKAVSKSGPHEAVGVLLLKNERVSVVEYSEIPKDLAEMCDPVTGQLVYSAGNIANHFYTLACLEDCARKYGDDVGYHIAEKAIPCATAPDGHTAKPASKNGIKLEMFIFDVFPLFDNVAVLEVSRDDEFSPLKNAPGSGVDCPETARDAVLALHRKWVESVGVVVPASVRVEVSPLLSIDGSGLEGVAFAEYLKEGECEVVVE